MTSKPIRETWFNLSQKEFADILGVPKRTVERWDGRCTMLPYVFDLAYHTLGRLYTDFQFLCFDKGLDFTKAGYIDFCKKQFSHISKNFSPDDQKANAF